MLVPQGYNLKTFEAIEHLLAVDLPLTNVSFSLLLEVGGLLAVICRINPLKNYK
ncbi:hypothetical protein [uncultured Virgibacillus sp.]|uniref:hypothetical protein n=1 Tax=uncultured Virgibacillus sp. TaxID=417355 RepID=UPI002611ABC1|nr:hypothetical protein [uncultured Virgibacillus sp.]